MGKPLLLINTTAPGECYHCGVRLVTGTLIVVNQDHRHDYCTRQCAIDGLPFLDHDDDCCPWMEEAENVS